MQIDYLFWAHYGKQKVSVTDRGEKTGFIQPDAS
jgi:hypothetical protein